MKPSTGTAARPGGPSRRSVLRAIRNSLPMVCGTLAVSYLLLGISHAVLLPPPTRPWMMAIALGSAVLYGGLWWLLVRARIPRKAAGSIAAAASIPMLVNSAAHLGLSGELHQTTNFMIHVVGWSAVILLPGWLTLVLTLTWGVWLSLAASLGFLPVTFHYAFAMGIATALGVAVFRLRRQALARQDHQIELIHIARRRAEASLGVRERFLGAVSHELRTPLNGILGTADLLGRTRLEPGARELLGMLRQSASGLLRTLDDVMEYTEDGPGAGSEPVQPLALAALTQEVASEVGQWHPGRALPVGCHTDPGVPEYVLANGEFLRRLLQRLLDNAMKFTVSGSVGVHWMCPRPGWIRCEVTDTGIGIPPAELPRLFQPFQQAESSTTRRFGGLGMGLALAHRAVTSRGGTLEIAQTSASGTRVAWELPLPAAPGTVPESATPAGAAVVLEAEGVARRMLLRQLARAGIPARAVGTPGELLQHLEGPGASLVLLDATTQDAALPDLLRRLASHPRRPGVRVAILVDPGEPGRDATWRGLGADAVLGRPLGVQALGSLLPPPAATPATA